MRIDLAKRIRSKTPSHWRIVLFGAALLLAFLFHVWSKIQVVEVGYAISTAREEQSRLLEQKEKLRLEIATLKSPGRLERIARTRLGLGFPTKDQIVLMDDEP